MQMLPEIHIVCRHCDNDESKHCWSLDGWADAEEETRGQWDEDEDEFDGELGIWWTHTGVCPECQKQPKQQAELF